MCLTHGILLFVHWVDLLQSFRLKSSSSFRLLLVNYWMGLYSPAHLPSRTKLGKVFLKLCTRREMEHYQLLTGVTQMSSTLSKSDILHANTRSLAESIFNEAYTSKFSFEFSSESYVSWCCFFLGLPPVNTLGNHTVAEGFDYPVQKCQSLHSGSSPFLDVVGCHAS